MTLITDTKALKSVCKPLHNSDYITIDTEFMRDKFYYPKLCLVQIAWEGGECAVDPLAEGIDLKPLFNLFNNEKVVKVFHSARQDIEIILGLSGKVPYPLFDTQVAAMVCGFGDSVSYAVLVDKIAGQSIDKSSRFTDWSRRPLSEKQQLYALSDVTYLRDVYKELKATLEKNKRMQWLAEEMEGLTNPSNYTVDPDEVWKKIKARGNSRRFFAAIKELAKWRELAAQELNRPRNFVLRDQPLLEIAAHMPKTKTELRKVREISKVANTRAGEIMELLEKAATMPEEDLPPLVKRSKRPGNYDKALYELLKVLLKKKCAEHNVAERLVADSSDLVQIVQSDGKEAHAMHGWRYEVFGKYAVELKKGKIALSAKDGAIKIVKL